MDISSCFLFIGQHTLCLQGVEGYCAASWTVAWWCEEVQVVAEESGNLRQKQWLLRLISFKQKRSLQASSATETLINTYISQCKCSAFCLASKLTSVFTAERWLHHQVSRMINVWAIKLSPAEMIALKNAAHSTHRVPARYSAPRPTGLCLPSAYTSQPTVHLIHKEKSFIPFLWLGSSCANCDLDSISEHLSAAHLSPAVLCYHISGKSPTWSSCSENSLLVTIKLSCTTANTTHSVWIYDTGHLNLAAACPLLAVPCQCCWLESPKIPAGTLRW